jgi:hypothetical protein
LASSAAPDATIGRVSITFQVSKVDPPRQPVSSVARDAALPRLLGAGQRGKHRVIALDGTESEVEHEPGAPSVPRRKLEAIYESSARLVAATDVSAVAQAAHDAFYGHYPLILSPDAVWFCLAQGFARHVNANAEALRSRFVRHQGKARITIERPDFLLGQANPWPEAFAAFSDGIAAHVGRLRDLVVADFSTTGPVERAATEVVLMDAFQAYFEYEMLAGCGIPQITLVGTPDDWRSVRRRASMLSEFDLAWWTCSLLPVLDEIVETAEGRIDQGFWRSFFRYQSGSGPSELTGWIMTLFPYLEGDRAPVRNPYLAEWERAFGVASSRTSWRQFEPEGPALGALPPSIASAPVKFVDVRDGSEHALRFVGGMFGVVQDEGGALAPEFGWAVVHDGLEARG